MSRWVVVRVIKSVGSTLSFYTPQGEQVRIIDGASAATNSYVALRGSPTSNPLIYAAGQTNANLDISSAGTSALRLYTNTLSQLQFQVSHTASAVNYVQVTGRLLVVVQRLATQGNDSSINLSLSAKGTGGVSSTTYFRAGTASVNYIQLTVEPQAAVQRLAHKAQTPTSTLR